MNDWNYTKKGAKVGLLYGLSGVVYWYALGILILNSQVYAINSTLMTCGLILALIGYILYFPLLIIPLHFSGILIIIFGATFGFLLDLGAVKKREKIKNTEEINKPEKGVFLRVPKGNGGSIITERTVNYCIFCLIIIIAVLFIIDISGITENYEVYGNYNKFLSSTDTINFDKDSGTFIEKTSGGTKTGTYEMNENLTLLTLCYSDGKTTEYYVENKAFRLVPANRSQYASDQEVEDNLYLKPKVM